MLMDQEEIIKGVQEFFTLNKKKYESLSKGKMILDFKDLIAYDFKVAEAILENADEGVRAIEEMAKTNFGIEKVIIQDINNLVPLKGLRKEHFGKLIEVEGIIRHRSGIKPRRNIVKLRCNQCGTATFAYQEHNNVKYPTYCPCGEKKNFRVDKEFFVDQISMQIEEIPSEDSVQFDKLDVKIEDPLTEVEFIHCYNPGERVKVTGILKREAKYVRGKPSNIFHRYFNAVNIQQLDEKPDDKITPADIKEFKEISKFLISKKIEFIAPAIVGHDIIKEALLLQLVGGVYREKDLTIKREFISILLVGDPSTGKSVIGRSIIPLKARARYVGGSKGATGVGLTAGLVRDEDGNFVLACGAVVLANGSILVIDEFEKMNQDAVEPLHEAMSIGTITINKGGINSTMNARTAILAIANPKFGRWDNLKPLIDQVELQPSLLSRFDFIFAVKDISSKDEDRKVIRGISNLKNHHEPKDYQLFRKFLAYSSKISPKLNDKANELIETFFVETREKARKMGAENSKVPLGFRQYDSLVRLTEAYAKLRLSKSAGKEDASAAIKMITKYLADLGVDLESGLAEIDKIEMGKTSSKKKADYVLDQIPEGTITEVDDVIKACKLRGLEKKEVENLIEKMRRDGDIFEPQPGFLKRL